MRNSSVSAALLGAIALESCATHPLPPPLSAAATTALCAVSRHLQWGPFGTVAFEEDRSKMAALKKWDDDADLQPLPSSLTCPDGRRRLHKPGEGIPFSAFGLSKDGRRAIISGGWFGGPQLGGGGNCYYELRDGQWQQIGCIETYSI
ncbi:MAG: hypothetical protein J7498_16080 [Sphingobium sp.]|nr:hypothetical protein [Sphingobium sp.]